MGVGVVGRTEMGEGSRWGNSKCKGEGGERRWHTQGRD